MGSQTSLPGIAAVTTHDESRPKPALRVDPKAVAAKFSGLTEGPGDDNHKHSLVAMPEIDKIGERFIKRPPIHEASESEHGAEESEAHLVSSPPPKIYSVADTGDRAWNK